MLIPNLPSLFRSTKPQRFDYKPIYYDPEKEAQDKREKARKASKASQPTGSIKFKPKSARSSMKSNLTILILVFLLSALAVYKKGKNREGGNC